MTDLTTSYLGLRLRSPIVASSSPMTGQLDTLRALDAAGIGAVVLPSLFEEQITQESLAIHDLLDADTGVHGEAAGGYLPEMLDYNTGPAGYLVRLEQAKAQLDVPVIASINGVTPSGWLRYARSIEDAGADAIELNVYRIAADLDTPGRLVEQEVIALVTQVCEAVDIPVAVKLGPYYSAFANLAAKLVTAGASGLVLFNRFYQPDIDLQTLDVSPHLILSNSHELRLPLRWIAILHGRLDASLAVTTGVHTWRDVAKSLLAGADVTMMASALLANGPDHVTKVTVDLLAWCSERGYDSVAQLRGSVSQQAAPDPSAFERANYLKTLTRYSNAFH